MPENPVVLLEFIKSIHASGAKRFVAKNKFRVGNKADKVLIAEIGGNFKEHLLDKIEEDVEDSELQIHQLLGVSRDVPITTELGGEKVAETTLTHLWSLLKKQGHGQDGDLLVNGLVNIFYIRDSDGVLWAVFACRLAFFGAWSIGALSYGGSHMWHVGRQTFSDNS